MPLINLSFVLRSDYPYKTCLQERYILHGSNIAPEVLLTVVQYTRVTFFYQRYTTNVKYIKSKSRRDHVKRRYIFMY